MLATLSFASIERLSPQGVEDNGFILRFHFQLHIELGGGRISVRDVSIDLDEDWGLDREDDASSLQVATEILAGAVEAAAIIARAGDDLWSISSEISERRH